MTMDEQNPNETSRPTGRTRGPIAWMAGNSVTANLLMIVILVGGLILSIQIKKEVFPDFELDMVSIGVSYPGASPEEVENGIILAIEESLQNVDGIKEIRATDIAMRIAG